MIRRNIIFVNLFEKLTLNTIIIKIRPYSEKKYKKHLKGEIKKAFL